VNRFRTAGFSRPDSARNGSSHIEPAKAGGPVARLVMVIVVSSAVVSAQDSRPSGRLFEGLEVRRASEDFRQLHRLGDATNAWVIEKASSTTWPGLRQGDVVIGDVMAGQSWVQRFEKCFRNHELAAIAELAQKGETADQMVDRLWNQEVARFLGTESRPASRPAPTSLPTADQMVDRLWSQAVKKVLPSAGAPVTQTSVAESQPFQK
jgi:hypothetical protein